MLGDGIDPVLLCYLPTVWRQRLTTRLEPDVRVLEVETVDALSASFHRFPLSIGVVGIDTPATGHAGDHVTALRDTFAQHAGRVVVGVLVSAGSLPVPTVRGVANLGLTEIFPLHDDRGLDTLARWVRRHRPRALHLAVWAAIEPSVDPRAATLFSVALRLAAAPYEVAELAVACRMSERTLRRSCERVGVPSPVWLKAMSRLLVAGFLLDRPNADIDRVADLLGFESTDALRKKARKWTGSSTTDLGKAGWIASLALMLTGLFRR